VYKLKSQVCPNSWIYLLIWVDDVQQFPIVDKGEVDVFLGIEIKRERSQRTLRLSQSKYVREILDEFLQIFFNPAESSCQTIAKQSAKLIFSPH